MINGILSYINVIQCRGEWIVFVAKSVDPQIFLFKSETTTTSGNRRAKIKSKLVSVTAIVNVAQTAKKATCLMTITQYNSTSCLTPEAPSTCIRIFSKTEIKITDKTIENPSEDDILYLKPV